MIEVWDYAEIISAKLTKDSGLTIGQEVVVVGSEMLPEKRSDPYLFRKYFIVVLVDKDGQHLFPNEYEGYEDNGHRAYRVNGLSLQKLSDERSKELHQVLKDTYETTN